MFSGEASESRFTAAATLDEADRWSPPTVPLRLPSIDEASDRTSFTSSSDPPSPTRNSRSSSSHSDRKRRRRRAGARALRFLRQNSFSQHAVFCLLSGRPLVIIGGNERMVRKLVEALSLFLPAPGPTGNAVMMCLTSPLQLTDLLTWRLIGIHRSVFIFKYLSAILDFLSINKCHLFLVVLTLNLFYHHERIDSVPAILCSSNMSPLEVVQISRCLLNDRKSSSEINTE